MKRVRGGRNTSAGAGASHTARSRTARATLESGASIAGRVRRRFSRASHVSPFTHLYSTWLAPSMVMMSPFLTPPAAFQPPRAGWPPTTRASGWPSSSNLRCTALHRTTESARAVDPKREAFARRARSATSGAPAAAREFIAKRAATSRGRVTDPRRGATDRASRERKIYSTRPRTTKRRFAVAARCPPRSDPFAVPAGQAARRRREKIDMGTGLESQTVITYVTCESRLTPIRPLWAHKSKKPTFSMPLSTRRNFLHTGKLNPETGIHFLSENPHMI